MPPQKRSSGKPANETKVEPASAASPRARGELPKKQVEAAVEKSAKFLEKQAEPPADVHPKATTPSKAEVEDAVEKSADHLRAQGVPVDSSAAAATPISAGGTDASLAAQPVDAGRDKTQDASPTFSAPVPNSPKE
jgi:predicted P-loop ATPase